MYNKNPSHDEHDPALLLLYSPNAISEKKLDYDCDDSAEKGRVEGSGVGVHEVVHVAVSSAKPV